MYGAGQGRAGGGKVSQRTSGVQEVTLRSGYDLDLKVTLRSPGGQPGSNLKGRVRTRTLRSP